LCLPHCCTQAPPSCHNPSIDPIRPSPLAEFKVVLPVRRTVRAFWLMVNEHKCPLICRPNEFEVSDVVLEIVGYTPIALAVGGADAMASALNTRRSATGLLPCACSLSSSPASCPPPSPSLAPAHSPFLSRAFETANAITHHCTQAMARVPSPVKMLSPVRKCLRVH
jgi:hypothetical protein